MPLHRGEPPPHKVRWALPMMMHRQRLMAAILGRVQLMPLMLMLNAFNPILAKAVLEAEDLPPLLMFTQLFPSVGQPVLADTMRSLARLLERYFQRRKLRSCQFWWLLTPRL
jgi:hypothetical protein